MPKLKRVGPPVVAPVVLAGMRVEALHWARERGLEQDGGYLVALDAASGEELWIACIYAIDYLAGMETDVQDIFIRSIAIGAKPGTLLVADERGRHFEFDIDQRKAMPLPQ